MASGASNPGHVFTPTDITAISAILDVATATLVSGDISSLPDLLNSNPAVQTVAARRPTLELSAGNGLPCMRFATNDVLSWPITAQSAASNQAGWGLWFKGDSVGSTYTLVRISSNTGGANGTKLTLSTASQTVTASASPDGTAIKTLISGNVLDTGWHFLTLEYDKDAATDATKLVMTLDGVGVGTIGGSATLGALFGATGNILIGNRQDTSSALLPFNGLIGPKIYAFGSKTVGATTGLMSSSERTSLMQYQQPT